MRLIATYVGPYGTTVCSRCREQLEPGERIFGDADTANIFCTRCSCTPVEKNGDHAEG